MDKGFQVDLRGLIDLLSRHLYSSPRIYVRELLQNAVDAVTARVAIEPGCEANITVRVDGSSVIVEDTGIGLTAGEVEHFLATIGRSSKRDALDMARSDFLGQFGIGLLSGFLVADRIDVDTRSASDPSAPAVHWTGFTDGTYRVDEQPRDDGDWVGSRVTLTARADASEWVSPTRVKALDSEFGCYLPYAISFVDSVETVDLTIRPAPWEREASNPADRAPLTATCGDLFGFDPLGTITLDVSSAGLRGTAFVLPSQVSPATRQTHRVYLKGMLLAPTVPDLLPEWAFFCRCIVNATELRPTASREAIYDDGLLGEVQEDLGRQIWDWVVQLEASRPDVFENFIRLHHLAIRALACTDPDLVDRVLDWLPFETTAGTMTLSEYVRRHPVVHFSRTVDSFRQVSAVAGVQGLAVVNGGYAYDSEIIEMLPRVRAGCVVEELDPSVVTAHLDPLSTDDELRLSGFLKTARDALAPLGCEVVLRSFDPLSLPGLFLDDRDGAHERQRQQTEAEADDTWAGILGSLRNDRAQASLVLNHRNPIVRRVETLDDVALQVTALEVLYGNAIVASRRQIGPTESAVLTRGLLGLLDAATRSGGHATTGEAS